MIVAIVKITAVMLVMLILVVLVILVLKKIRSTNLIHDVISRGIGKHDKNSSNTMTIKVARLMPVMPQPRVNTYENHSSMNTAVLSS